MTREEFVKSLKATGLVLRLSGEELESLAGRDDMSGVDMMEAAAQHMQRSSNALATLLTETQEIARRDAEDAA